MGGDIFSAGLEPTTLEFDIFAWRSTSISIERVAGYCGLGLNVDWLGYIGDHTTQLYRDHNKPL